MRLIREHPGPGNSKNSETSWIFRGFPPDYIAILFAAQIQSKVVELASENPVIFRL